MPEIARIMTTAGVARAGRILCDVGPGSFTGVRVGLAAARALGLAWAVPVVGVPGDALVARALFARADAPDRVAVLLDALRGELFGRVWTRGGPEGAHRVLNPAGAADLARDAGAAAGGGVALIARAPAWTDPAGPAAAAAVHVAPGDLVAATPLYIRAPDAKARA